MDINLSSKQALKKLLKEKGIRPLKRMGQNFLTSRLVLDKIIKSAELEPQDIVLEIGPGIGTLTVELAQGVKKVVAVEKDKRLVGTLTEILEDSGIKNVEVVEGDIMTLKFQITNSKLQTNSKFQILNSKLLKSYKVVANLPFNIATALIRKFLETEHPPELMVVMVQKEVGQRICSSPSRHSLGEDKQAKMSKLGVFCQFYGKPEIVSFVSKQSFWPQPKVDSVILRITPLLGTDKKLIDADKNLFSKIVNIGFSHPRKQLVNNFSSGLKLSRGEIEQWLLKNNVKPSQRAETLTVDNWVSLTENFKNKC